MSDALLDAISGPLTVFDLARQLRVGMPQSHNHPQFWHTLPRRHGDMVRPDGGSAANDMITMGTHVGTHIDALAHVSHDGHLHGDVDVIEGLEGGLYRTHGVHTIPPFVGRGVLLDIAGLLGVDICDPGYEITPADLQAAAERQGTAVRSGDAVLVRSGWARHWDDGARYRGLDDGVPGPGEAAARWLADQGATIVGADTIAFECLPPGQGHALLPAHRVLLVEAGIPIVETLDLEELAAGGHHEFGFVIAPLKLVGATGSPIRPLALVGSDR